MLITSLNDIGFVSDVVHIGEDELYNSNFVIMHSGYTVYFTIFDLQHFEKLNAFCSKDCFEQIVSDGQFEYQPHHKNFEWDVYLGRGEVTMQYCIKNECLVVVSYEEKQPGVYTIFVQGAWKIAGILSTDPPPDLTRKNIVIQPGEYIRGCTKTGFLNSVTDFQWGANKLIADEAWGYFKEEQWGDLEQLFKSNNLNVFNNKVLPPNSGFISFTRINLPIGYEFYNYAERYKLNADFDGNYIVPKDALNIDETAVLKKYRVVKMITNVLAGQSIPWSGNFSQAFYYLPFTIKNLRNLGLILEI